MSEVETFLNDKYNYYVKLYGSDRVLGIFLNENKIGRYFVIYVPKEDELYYSYPSDDNNILDIRLLYKKIIKNEIYYTSCYINKIYKDNFNSINHYIKNKKELDELNNKKYINIDLSKIKEDIKRIIKTKDNNNINNFFEELTETEKNALKFILNKINKGNELISSVSLLIQESNISRPVYTSLFYKIKDKELGEINNRGVKGTQIIFNDIDKIKKYLI